MAKRKQKKLPTIMTNDEVRTFLNTFDKHTRTGYRDYVLAAFLFKTGCRVSEALACRYENITSHVNFEGKTLYNYKLLHSKNGSQAIIPIPEEIYEMILELSKKFKHLQRGYVFTTVQKEPVKDSFVRRKFAEKGREAELPYNMHPHLTRHKYLSSVYNATKDIVLTQQAGRHKALSSVQTYIHLNPEAVRDASKYIEI